MPQQVEAATPIRISSITPKLVSRKLRVAGRMLAYDPKSAILLLVDEDSAVFVNTSLCLDPVESHAWLRENNSVVSALGYLEELPSALPLPTLPLHARPTQVDPHLMLSAIVLKAVPDLDMVLWNGAIQERER
ncbi:hypothetical protein AcV5_003547 [Taiwanofungus camphoratus]|nr:hypothetical protein AcV5_003547 [Antrodia cinnamomea]